MMGYCEAVVKRVRNIISSSSRDLRWESLLIVWSLSDTYFFFEGEYKYLCCWVDCKWCVVQCHSLLNERNIFEFSCVQYSLVMIRDHVDHVYLFSLFWLYNSILLFASFFVNPTWILLLSPCLLYPKSRIRIRYVDKFGKHKVVWSL